MGAKFGTDFGNLSPKAEPWFSYQIETNPHII